MWRAIFVPTIMTHTQRYVYIRQDFQADSVRSVFAVASILFMNLTVLDPKFIRIPQNTHFDGVETVL